MNKYFASGLALIAASATAAVAIAAPAAASSKNDKAVAALKAKGGAESITLTWKPPPSTVDVDTAPKVSYDVLMDNPTTPAVDFEVVESRTKALSYKAIDLGDNTKYTFKVIPYIDRKAGTAKTITGLTLPGRVINLGLKSTTSLLTWEAPADHSEPLTYTVLRGTGLTAVGITDTFLKLDPAVACNTSQSFSVKAVNTSGEGPVTTATIKADKCPTS